LSNISNDENELWLAKGYFNFDMSSQMTFSTCCQKERGMEILGDGRGILAE